MGEKGLSFFMFYLETMIFWEEIAWFTDESRKQQLWSRLKNKRACYKEVIKDAIYFIFHLMLGEVVILFTMKHIEEK